MSENGYVICELIFREEYINEILEKFSSQKPSGQKTIVQGEGRSQVVWIDDMQKKKMPRGCIAHLTNIFITFTEDLRNFYVNICNPFRPYHTTGQQLPTKSPKPSLEYQISFMITDPIYEKYERIFYVD